MMPIGAAPMGGMAGAEARIAAIRSRIDEVVGQRPGQAGAATFSLPASPADGNRVVDLPDLPRRGQLTAADISGRPVVTAPAGPAGPAASDGPRPAVAGAVVPALPATATSTSLAAKLPEAAGQWLPAIEQAATAAGLDVSLLAAVVRHESNFDQSVVSHAGAIGLAQLMPGTAEWLKVDPYDPIQNLDGGARYLKEQLDRFGAVDLALAAYNAGPNRVVQAGGVPRIPETLAYVDRVISTWEQLR